MFKNFITILILSVCAGVCFGQFDPGARSHSMGNASVGLSDDVWAIFSNVGGLSQLDRSEVSFFYSPQPFGVPELSLQAVALALPTTFGVIGVSGKRYGFELYREFSGSLSYANNISQVGIGVALVYHSITIQNYGSASTLGIDIGFHIPIIERLNLGFSAKNINAPTLGSSKEKLPQIFSTGLVYRPIEKFSICADYQKELRYDASPRFGFEYWMVEEVALRGGVSNEPSLFTGGFGVRYLLFQVDYAFSSHQELGGTHQVSISIRWGKGEE